MGLSCRPLPAALGFPQASLGSQEGLLGTRVRSHGGISAWPSCSISLVRLTFLRARAEPAALQRSFRNRNCLDCGFYEGDREIRIRPGRTVMIAPVWSSFS